MPNTYHVEAEVVHNPERHLFIALLAGRPVEPAMLEFLWQMQADLAARKISTDLFVLANHCHVDDARNICVYEFFKTSCSHFLFLDDDTCTTKSAVGDLLMLDRDVVAGSYPYKEDTGNFPIRMLDGPPKYEADGCVEVQMVPTGFLMMKRKVLEDATAGARWYRNKEIAADGPPVYELFHREVDSLNERWGGDYNFCRKLIKLGIPIYVKPNLWFRHYGAKAFGGNFAMKIAEGTGESTPEFTAAVEAIRTGEANVLDFMQLQLHWPNIYAMPSDALHATTLIAAETAGPILETGSGLTTLILGLVAEQAGRQVYSLEHDPDYYAKTIALLKRHNIRNVRLMYAPLQVHHYAEGKSCLWYSRVEELPESFGFVLWDGPQRRFGRDGLFKLIPSAVANAKIVVDDLDVKEDLAMVQRWTARQNFKLHTFKGGTRLIGVMEPLAEAEKAKVSEVA